MSFFEQSRLQLRQWIVLVYWWAREYPVKDAAEEAEVDEKTAIQIYQYCRDLCSWRLLNHDSPMMLGGQGVVVQIDESLFRHKPKNHRGRATSREVWVFGHQPLSCSGGHVYCPQSLEKTAIQIYQYCRDLCSWRLLNHDSPMMLGGQGVVVQIDESLFRHKPKKTPW